MPLWMSQIHIVPMSDLEKEKRTLAACENQLALVQANLPGKQDSIKYWEKQIADTKRKIADLEK